MFLKNCLAEQFPKPKRYLVVSIRSSFNTSGLDTSRFDVKSFQYKWFRYMSFRYKVVSTQVVSMQSRFDTSRFDTNRSRSDTPLKSIRCKNVIEVFSYRAMLT